MKKFYTSLFTFLWLIAFTAYGQTYQLPNPGFEGSWDSSSNEPEGFHSFYTGEYKSVILQMAGKTNAQLNSSTDVRPGSTGTYSACVSSRSAFGVAANGNMTTGRIYAGSTTATSTDNHNRSNPEETGYNQPFTGKADSLTLWVKFHPKDDSYYARVNGIIHGDSYYQDPEDVDYSDVKYAHATLNFPTNEERDWERLSIPFIIDNETVEPAYLLLSFSTDSLAGGGSTADTLYIDDIEFIYNSQLASLTIDGEEIGGFDKDTYEYTVYTSSTENPFNEISLVATANGVGASVETSISGSTATITVKGNDYEVNEENIHTYTITAVGIPESLSLTYGESFNFIGLNNATFSFSDATVATNEGEKIIPLKAGTTTLTVSATGLTSTNIALTVEKVPLTITVADASRNYGGANPEFTFVYTGLVNGEDSSILDGEPTAACEADETSMPGTYPITVEGFTDDRYEVTTVNGTLTIEKAPLTISVIDVTRKYGEEAELVSYDGLFEGDEIELQISCDGAASTAIPGEYEITLEGTPTDDRYEITVAVSTGTLTIEKADLTITVSNQTITYGDAIPTFTLSYEGLINEDVLDLQPLCEATETSVPGEYEIYLESPTDDRYEITVTDGTLTVEKATLTVTADSATREAGKENPEFTLSYEGFANNEEASVLDVAPVASCEADATSEAGTYAITVSGGEDDCYDFIYVDGVLTVTAPVSGVTAASADEVSIYLANRQLVVKGVNVDQVEFYTVSGQMAGSYAPGDIVTLPAGLYIVKAGKVAHTLHIAR